MFSFEEEISSSLQIWRIIKSNGKKLSINSQPRGLYDQFIYLTNVKTHLERMRVIFLFFLHIFSRFLFHFFVLGISFSSSEESENLFVIILLFLLILVKTEKLGFSVKQTMSSAQRLYEAGLITYMRTDSVNLSDDAIKQISKFVKDQYGNIGMKQWTNYEEQIYDNINTIIYWEVIVWHQILRL